MGGPDNVVFVVLATALCYISVLFLNTMICVSNAGEHGNVMLGCYV